MPTLVDGTDIPKFCAACPQPGVNLPDNWAEDPDQLVQFCGLQGNSFDSFPRMAYTHTFVVDGNFSAIHQNQETAHRNIKLSHGEFFMTEPNRYKLHLAVALEVKEVGCFTFSFSTSLTSNQKSTCNEHHAINDRFVKYKGLDVTGVGATACSRHGCFCPRAVVDFQKGER
jgi:hypothetical protein